MYLLGLSQEVALLPVHFACVYLWKPTPQQKSYLQKAVQSSYSLDKSTHLLHKSRHVCRPRESWPASHR